MNIYKMPSVSVYSSIQCRNCHFLYFVFFGAVSESVTQLFIFIPGLGNPYLQYPGWCFCWYVV